MNQFAYLFLKNSDFNTVLLLLSSILLPSILSMTFIAPTLYRKYGTRLTSIFSYITLLLLYIIGYYWIQSELDENRLYLLLCLISFAFGPALAANFVLITNCIDYGKKITGFYNRQLTFSFAVFFGVLGSTIGNQIIANRTITLTVADGVNSDILIDWMKFIFLGQPIWGAIFITILLYLYYEPFTLETAHE